MLPPPSTEDAKREPLVSHRDDTITQQQNICCVSSLSRLFLFHAQPATQICTKVFTNTTRWSKVNQIVDTLVCRSRILHVIGRIVTVQHTFDQTSFAEFGRQRDGGTSVGRGDCTIPNQSIRMWRIYSRTTTVTAAAHHSPYYQEKNDGDDSTNTVSWHTVIVRHGIDSIHSISHPWTKFLRFGGLSLHATFFTILEHLWISSQYSTSWW